jgi:hypothetical protein
MKDPSKPDGEAVNADGSLKPADQIKWLNSPADESRPPIQHPYEDMGDAAPHNHENDDDFDIDIYGDVENAKADVQVDDDKMDDSDDSLAEDNKMDDKADEEKNEETEKEEEAGEEPEEDVDKEADKRYWEAKTKEGVGRVCMTHDCGISEAVITLTNLCRQRKKVRPHEIYGSVSSTTLALLMVW